MKDLPPHKGYPATQALHIRTLLYNCYAIYMTAATFASLAEPSRLRMLDLLRERPRAVGELVDALGLSQPGVSRHLRVLREANLVSVRPDAQRRIYEVRPEPLSEIDAWLEPYRDLFTRHLDSLERHLDDTKE
jgi:DNA-binding transcriptional ArsR family regulator